MRVERVEDGVVEGLGQQAHGRQQLTAGVRERLQGRGEDVVALLDQVEMGEVAAAAVAGIGGPGVEVAAVGQVVVDQARDDPGDQRVTVAVALQVLLHLPGIAAHAAGA